MAATTRIIIFLLTRVTNSRRFIASDVRRTVIGYVFLKYVFVESPARVKRTERNTVTEFFLLFPCCFVVVFISSFLSRKTSRPRRKIYASAPPHQCNGKIAHFHEIVRLFLFWNFRILFFFLDAPRTVRRLSRSVAVYKSGTYFIYTSEYIIPRVEDRRRPGTTIRGPLSVSKRDFEYCYYFLIRIRKLWVIITCTRRARNKTIRQIYEFHAYTISVRVLEKN